MSTTEGLEEEDWHSHLRMLSLGQGAAFVGAGACLGLLPLGGQIAMSWSEEYAYPLADRHSLPEVAQFLAVKYGALFPKKILAELVFRNAVPPDFSSTDQPHSILARLPFSVYITTNYDDFMTQALIHCGKDPIREICNWKPSLKKFPSVFEAQPGFIPTPKKPVVFHLHGHGDLPESMVLTEDDYLDFLLNASKHELLPTPIRHTLATSSLVFVGYGFRDWTFRVLFRGLVQSIHPSDRLRSIAQQLLPWTNSEQERENLQQYLRRYFDNVNVRVYWGDIGTFLLEFLARWKQFESRSNLVDVERTADVGKQLSQAPGARVFISYAREDEERAKNLYKSLADAGFTPWMDKYQILPGERWRFRIKAALKESDFFLACLSSKAALKRGYLQREFKDALDLWQEKLEEDIYLIPVRFDECEVPDQLNDFQWVDLFEESGLERLIQAIKIGLQRRTK